MTFNYIEISLFVIAERYVCKILVKRKDYLVILLFMSNIIELWSFLMKRSVSIYYYAVYL